MGNKKIKIYGAGSIGNHLANASRAKGWAVDICDIDPVALERTKNMIYPGDINNCKETPNRGGFTIKKIKKIRPIYYLLFKNYFSTYFVL